MYKAKSYRTRCWLPKLFALSLLSISLQTFEEIKLLGAIIKYIMIVALLHRKVEFIFYSSILFFFVNMHGVLNDRTLIQTVK